ncbi:Yip1 family protein [Bacillus sonorensis]|uniref:Antimicrobial peptide ABC transporter permease YknW n=2 Tax=Bacillus sonorensis TaxID=119858 RepID=M5P4Y2_9BACI|nr:MULTISPECIES: Yip1 family protein [Bacillus]TWK71783.1 Membrane protein YknW [Bacillus paralicheniformis]ASB89811.1 Membrane protein YknW [Bacillus sonorensis]EME74488.1 antimicrobial peptide ABC transporter permease YknW [Bacillus sonorensis L12]MBG9916946.1 peptide ABC transporter permease [Bacillus sonorensis]MCF7619064.1 YIP1 family protein [Bacillus sonorensis]
MESQLDLSKEGRRPSLLGLITSPGEQFERMRDKPVFWLPLVVVLIISVAGAYFLNQKLSISSELQELPNAELITSVLSVISIVGSIIGSTISLLVSALIYWLIVKIGKGQTDYVHMFSLAVFIYFIGAIGQLINGAVISFANIDPEVIVTSLNGVIPAGQPLKSLLAVFEIFAIWKLILLALGLQKVGGISKKAAWTGVAVLFVISILLALIGGLFINFSESFEGAL